MGRYDKIRYWNGSSWVQPKEIKYWNGSSWVSYGANDSSSTNELKYWNGSSWVRATLNKKVTTVTGEKYLQYNGNAAISLGKWYQFYNAKFEFVAQLDSLGNYMLYEVASASSSPANYARFGVWNDGTYKYAYCSNRYNSNTAAETNTKGQTNLATGVKYTFTASLSGDQLTVKAYNHSTGGTVSKTSGANRFYYYGSAIGTMLAGYSVSGRNFYGKVWDMYIQGCWSTTTTNNIRFDVDSSAAGSSSLTRTSYSNAGSGSAPSSVTHYGTIVDPSYTTTSWI